MDNIKFSDFETICRTCMSTYNLINIQGNNIIDVLKFLSGSKYSTIDELPQHLCIKCIGLMNEIQTFAVQCKQTHLILSNCLIDFKNNQNSENETPIPEDKVEFIEIKQEIIDEEFVAEQLIKEEQMCEQIMTEGEIKKEEIIIPDPIETIDDTQETSDYPRQTSEDARETVEQTPESTNLKHKCKRPSKCGVCSKPRFECNICMKSFQQSNDLLRHKRIHSGERPYQCEICNKTFSLKNILVMHKAIHTDERRFKCDICTKSFKQSAHLIAHKRIHSGDRPYQCEVCHKTFSNETLLDTHKIIHSDERRFECDICLKGFNFSSHLIQHKRIHSGKRLLQCNICGKKFIDLTKHKLKVHSVNELITNL